MEVLHKKNLVYLRKKEGLSQEQLAQALGYARSMYKEYEYEKQHDTAFLLKISRHFDISINDFLEKDLEEQDKWRQENEMESMDVGGLKVLTITVNEKQKENIEFVPIKAKAGYLAGHADPQFILSLKRFHLPLTSAGTFRAFEIDGDSMPPHQNGSIIIGRYVDSWHEVKNLKTYVVVTKDEGVVYKRILNKVREKGHLVLMSDNPLYPPSVKKMADIAEIWEYHCHIGFNASDRYAQAVDERVLNKIDELSLEVAELGNIVKGKLGYA
jgi:transcriptional regulator with XRE-family HTH domain